MMELEIEIRGEPGAGKTRMARLIMAMLHRRGFKATLVDDPNEPPFKEGQLDEERILRHLAETRTVTVRTKPVRKVR